MLYQLSYGHRANAAAHDSGSAATFKPRDAPHDLAHQSGFPFTFPSPGERNEEFARLYALRRPRGARPRSVALSPRRDSPICAARDGERHDPEASPHVARTQQEEQKNDDQNQAEATARVVPPSA